MQTIAVRHHRRHNRSPDLDPESMQAIWLESVRPKPSWVRKASQSREFYIEYIAVSPDNVPANPARMPRIHAATQMKATPVAACAARFLTQWLFLLVALLTLGGYMAFAAQRHYVEVGSGEEQSLASQATVIEKNLLRQIAATDAAINNTLQELSAWRLQRDGFKGANRRLQVLSATLDGIPNILITDALGRVISSNLEDLIG
ncbi:MAG: hypothetical protein WCH44_07775, partial [Betaproteobacteria bacterium]